MRNKGKSFTEAVARLHPIIVKLSIEAGKCQEMEPMTLHFPVSKRRGIVLYPLGQGGYRFKASVTVIDPATKKARPIGEDAIAASQFYRLSSCRAVWLSGDNVVNKLTLDQWCDEAIRVIKVIDPV
ncbi:hypothetical protein Gekk315_00073 [Aeromonas phage Gekk3-15]